MSVRITSGPFATAGATSTAGHVATWTCDAGQPALTAVACHAGSATSSASRGPALANAGIRGVVSHVIHGLVAGMMLGRSARETLGITTAAQPAAARAMA